MFKAYFSSLSTIFTKDIKAFFYLTLTSDENMMTSYEVIKTVYKVELNKALKMNKITNKTLRRFVDVVTKQFRFFFNRCN